VVFKDQEAKRVNRGTKRCGLLQDVNAILLAIDHARNTAHLSLKPTQSIEQDLAIFCVAVPDVFCHTP
jgi:hypothetical protein